MARQGELGWPGKGRETRKRRLAVSVRRAFEQLHKAQDAVGEK